MSDISKIDKNFIIGSTINKEGIRFYNALNAPFSIHGVMHSNGAFHRIPISVAEAVNDGVKTLNYNTAGGRVRFRTNSTYISEH